jgi:hypothetical protein
VAEDIPRRQPRAVPMEYRNVTFRSTLEADWAATLDTWGVLWSYEPMAVDLGDGTRYLCDFWLSGCRVWLEVKGPCEDRLEKTKRLQRAVQPEPWDWQWRPPFVMVGRTAEQGMAVWHGALENQDITLRGCGRCGGTSFMDRTAEGPWWWCRICGHQKDNDWVVEHQSGSLPFVHAPRPRWVG